MSDTSDTFSVKIGGDLGVFSNFFYGQDGYRRDVNIGSGTTAIRVGVVTRVVRPGYLGDAPSVPLAVIEKGGATVVIGMRTVARVTASFMPYATTYFKSRPHSVYIIAFSDAAVTSSAAVPVTVRESRDRVVLVMFPRVTEWVGRTVGRDKVIVRVVGITHRHPEGEGAAVAAGDGTCVAISTGLSVIFGVLSSMSAVAPDFASLNGFFYGQKDTSSALQRVSARLTPSYF